MEKNQKGKPNSSKPNKEGGKDFSYIRFSGIAFEMLGFVLVGYWLGTRLDIYFQTESTFTLIGILIGITGAMLNLFRKLPKD